MPIRHNTLNLLQSRAVEGSWERYRKAAREACNNRKIFRTGREYIGLGPRALQDGDGIWILFGAKMPFVLRAKGKHYQLVGECYIHGIMYGEAMTEVNEGNLLAEEIELC
jgi:hypothetical protein